MGKGSPLPIHVDGTVDTRFEDVRKMFTKNFISGREREGAALAVYLEGKLVIDLWGGYAEYDAVRKWEHDTMTLAFSSTKALAALAIAHLVDRGLMTYDDLVTKHWPEFGANGKEKVTVAQLVGHQAGLALLDQELTLDLIASDEAMSRAIEEQTPNWEPGTKTGYHVLTHGFPLAQLLRRVDPKHQSIGQYIREELILPTGNEIDCFIGLPLIEQHRVTHMNQQSPYNLKGTLLKGGLTAARKLSTAVRGKSMVQRVFENPFWAMGGTWMARNGFNNPAVHRLEIAAANGITTARALGQPFNALVMGKLIGQETMDSLFHMPEHSGKKDAVINMKLPAVMGLGLWSGARKVCPHMVGHPGTGGQDLQIDRHEKLVFVYLTNGLKELPEGTAHSERLLNEVYRCLRNAQVK